MDETTAIPEKLCAYCGLRPAVEMEHVIAKCIIPPPRPTMITVPACGICNDNKKHDDEQLRDMLAIDIENEGHEATGGEIKRKVIRSFDRNQSGFLKQARGKSVYEERLTVEGESLGHAKRAFVDSNRINAIFSWIVRGLLFKMTGERLPQDCTFAAGKVNIGKEEEAIRSLKELGAVDGPAIPPHFESILLRSKSDPTVCMWILRFFKVHVWVHTNVEKLDLTR